MKDWQFNVLFCAGVFGALFLLVAPAFSWGEDIPKNPGAITGVGVILTYVLSQKSSITKHDDEPKKKSTKPKAPPEGGEEE